MLLPSQSLVRTRSCLLHLTVRHPISHSYRRYTSYDGRQRLSGYWAPNVRGTNADPKTDDTHALLIKTGLIQRAYSGVYQFLPLGLRVQEKIERLIDTHMRSIGASKLSLSALSSEALWRKSGRLQDDDSELLRLRSRAKDAFLLSPTHEEEITKLMSGTIRSPKDLPIRLYQISRKYRDEMRPRFGLLRTREFLMKDLYTFDTIEEIAMQTYFEVKAAYHRFFDDLGLRYLVADADSGSMGGSLSHEFHFPAPQGEDTLFSCGNCDYVANEELAEAHRPRRLSEAASEPAKTQDIRTWIGNSRDGRTMVIVLYSNNHAQPQCDGDLNVINESALKKLVPDLDTEGEEASLTNYKYSSREVPWSELKSNKQRILIVRDVDAVPYSTIQDPLSIGSTKAVPISSNKIPQDITQHLREDLETTQPPLQIETIYSTIPLTRVTDGSHCPRCHLGTLSSQRSIEIGHTFHLGTRYSAPLGAVIPSANTLSSSTTSAETVPIQMGCHGVGITRLIAASASMLSDEKGLNWPVKIAPFAAMIVPSPSVAHGDVETLYDALTDRGARGNAASEVQIDAAIDDRSDMTLVQKLKDADLVGYPVLVVLGKRWSNGEGLVEVQCRRLNLKVFVEVQGVGEVVKNALARLEGAVRT